jgi:hypothetical protein
MTALQKFYGQLRAFLAKNWNVDQVYDFIDAQTKTELEQAVPQLL